MGLIGAMSDDNALTISHQGSENRSASSLFLRQVLDQL